MDEKEMKQIKKRLFFIIFMFVAIFLFMTTIEVQAAKITIVRDNNPEGVTVLSLFNEKYSIEIDDETEIGYVVYTVDGVDEIIGSCEVIVIDSQNPSGYVLCSDEIDRSCGSLTITITNELTGEGFVSSVSGDLGYVFCLNSNIKLE